VPEEADAQGRPGGQARGLGHAEPHLRDGGVKFILSNHIKSGKIRGHISIISNQSAHIDFFSKYRYFGSPRAWRPVDRQLGRNQTSLLCSALSSEGGGVCGILTLPTHRGLPYVNPPDPPGYKYRYGAIA